jgi:hypothetical protein
MNINEQINEFLLSVPEITDLNQFTSQFQLIWLELGRNIQQTLVQQKIEEAEAHYTGARTKREKRYYTPLGEMRLKRRVYPTELGLEIKVDKKLGLPPEKWLPSVLELACALGINSEFPNSHRLFAQWTRINRKKKGRGKIRQREYVATLKSRKAFRERVQTLYQQIVKEKNPQIVVIGDGAHWIWEMAEEQFPNSLEILDFYHLSEYVWKVAKASFPNQEENQKNWVKIQLELLKESQWKTVIKNSYELKIRSKKFREALEDLEGYLNNNSTRIDYKFYLKQGLMIGSGVVESSNRRVVTQRLKQAGMHWSSEGAEGVMALRAAYLSHSNRWQNFWQTS